MVQVPDIKVNNKVHGYLNGTYHSRILDWDIQLIRVYIYSDDGLNVYHCVQVSDYADEVEVLEGISDPYCYPIISILNDIFVGLNMDF